MDRAQIITQGLCVMGFCNGEELGALVDLVKGAPPQNSLVEIGVWFGRTLTVFGLAAHEGQLVVGIDPFTPGIPGGTTFGPATYQQVRTTLDFSHLQDVVLLPAASQSIARFWGAPISVLFLDGDHSSFGVWQDITGWQEFVVPGGCVIFHDYTHPSWPGVKEVVDKWHAAVGDKWSLMGQFAFLRAYRRKT